MDISTKTNIILRGKFLNKSLDSNRFLISYIQSSTLKAYTSEISFYLVSDLAKSLNNSDFPTYYYSS